MLIIKPHEPIYLPGAPNLSKGMEVFNLAANMAVDEIVSPAIANSPYLMLCSAHNSAYVRGVLEGHTANGYGNTDELVNQHSVYSCEMMCAAAAHVFSSAVVFAPTSGFHHAGHNFGGGYCTFNGLVVAAMTMRAAKPDATVLIVDGDGHYGDGTADIISSLGLSHWLQQCSLDKSSVQGNPEFARHKLKTMLSSGPWDLVIYQAGADAHIEDPFYAGYLDDADWAARDNLVFTMCRNSSIPVIFNLAGGYNGKKTTMLHLSTVETARRVFFGAQSPAHLSPEPSAS